VETSKYRHRQLAFQRILNSCDERCFSVHCFQALQPPQVRQRRGGRHLNFVKLRDGGQLFRSALVMRLRVSPDSGVVERH
jgi:hypothetical protein